jgi:hypothetical protein
MARKYVRRNSNDANTPIKARDVFCQVKRVKTARHLGSYNSYIDKKQGLLIQSMTPEQMVHINNVWNQMTAKQIDGGKGGRLADIAKNVVVSLPPYMEDKIDRTDERQMRDLVEYVIADFLKGVGKQHPHIDLKWLKKNMSVSIHFDTSHLHFHILVPTYVQDKRLYISTPHKIDYSKRSVSFKTRRSAYNWCKRTLKTPNMTTADFIEIAKKEASKPKLRSKKQLRDMLEEKIKEEEQAKYEFENATYDLEQQGQETKIFLEDLFEQNIKWINKINNKIYRIMAKWLNQEIEDNEALALLDKIIDDLQKTENETLREALVEVVYENKKQIIGTGNIGIDGNQEPKPDQEIKNNMRMKK